LKKQSSLSTNKDQEVSVDVDTTIAEQNMNVTESVLDGKNKQVRDVSASLTSSMQDTTVSHFNASKKDIEIDGQLSGDTQYAGVHWTIVVRAPAMPQLGLGHTTISDI
jgi:hypothetical protein